MSATSHPQVAQRGSWLPAVGSLGFLTILLLLLVSVGGRSDGTPATAPTTPTERPFPQETSTTGTGAHH